jgi:RimJ/RimL family protein N-acetyltransferase
MFNYGPTKDKDSLIAILRLQQANLPSAISDEEAREQGFLTVSHEMSLLSAMNEPYYHTAAWMDDELVGYALVMEDKYRHEIEILIPLFELIDSLSFKHQPLTDWNYFLMGQVCVAKKVRGRGVFKGLYQNLGERLNAHFELIVTEIATRNTRSMRAHEKVGFEVIHTYTGPTGEEWAIVVWPI